MEPVTCNLPSPFFKCGERISRNPQVYQSFDEVSSVRRDEPNHIRSIAPYILQVKEQNEKFYLKYVAAVGRMKFTQVNRELLKFLQKLPSTVQRQIGKHCQIPEKFICIVFDILDNHLASFSGYFIVEPNSLYKPDEAKASTSIQLTSTDEISSQLGLISVANKHLVAFEEYFLNQEDDLMALHSEIHPFILQAETIANPFSNVETNTKISEKMSEPILVDLSDDPEVLSIYPTSSMNSILSLKNRKEVIFDNFNAVTDECRRLTKYVIPYNEAYERYRHICTTELSCQNVSFCSTKFYAEVAGAGDESNELRFFTRVFLVGRDGRHAIVVPYNNTEDREQFELLAPFATEALYQRFEDAEPTANDTVKKLNPCDLSLDQIHIPLFVALHDTVTILRYWRTFRSYRQTPTSMIQIDLEPSDPDPDPALPVVKEEVKLEKFIKCAAVSSTQLRRIQHCLRKKIERLVCPEFQKSVYQFPASWDDPHSVNQLFCDNLRRSVVHWALRFCRGFVRVSNHLDGADKIYACKPKVFLARYVQFFGISDLDTFSCYNVGGFSDDPKREFCREVNVRNVYNHLMKKHHNSLKFTTMKESKLLRFRPFVLVPGTVTDKTVLKTQDVLEELKALHAHFEEQSRRGLDFFDVMKNARVKKKQSILMESKGIANDVSLDTEEAHFVDSASLDCDPCDPLAEQPHETSHISTSTLEIDHNSESTWSESLKLVEDFIPMHQVSGILLSFATNWVRAYVGLTDCLAQIPNCEDKFVPNVVILGHYDKYFLVLPFKTDILSGKMNCSRPFATENIFSRKNRHMPQVSSEEVDLRPPVLDQISVEDLAYILKLRDLVNWAPAHVRSEIINRCGIPVGIPPKLDRDSNS